MRKKKYKVTKTKEYIYNDSYSTICKVLQDDTYGICPAPLPAQTALHILCDYLFGDDYYIGDSLGVEQGNTLVVRAILDKYSKEWKQDCKHYNKTNKNQVD